MTAADFSALEHFSCRQQPQKRHTLSLVALKLSSAKCPAHPHPKAPLPLTFCPPRRTNTHCPYGAVGAQKCQRQPDPFPGQKVRVPTAASLCMSTCLCVCVNGRVVCLLPSVHGVLEGLSPGQTAASSSALGSTHCGCGCALLFVPADCPVPRVLRAVTPPPTPPTFPGLRLGTAARCCYSVVRHNVLFF